MTCTSCNGIGYIRGNRCGKCNGHGTIGATAAPSSSSDPWPDDLHRDDTHKHGGKECEEAYFTVSVTKYRSPGSGSLFAPSVDRVMEIIIDALANEHYEGIEAHYIGCRLDEP